MTPVKITNPHLEAEHLTAAAAEAERLASEARDRAEAARKLAEERRLAEVAAIRQRRLESFDDAALDADVKATRDRFAEAVRSGGTGLAEFVDLQVATTRRYLVAVEAEVARAAVAPERPAIPTGGPTELVWSEEVQKVLARVIANRVADLADEMQAELDAAGR